jgi:hypothetical protein
MRSLVSFAYVIIVLAASAFSQEKIALTGKVVDPKGAPVTGAVVNLKGKNLLDTTDNNGHFAFVSLAAALPGNTAAARQLFCIRQNSVEVLLERECPVAVRVYDVSGRLVSTAFDKRLPAGIHNIGLPMAELKGHACLLGISTGPETHNVKMIDGNSGKSVFAGLQARNSSLAKQSTAVPVDSITVEHRYYFAAKVQVASYTESLVIALNSSSNYFSVHDTFVDSLIYKGVPPTSSDVHSMIDIWRTFYDTTGRRLLKLAESIPPDTNALFAVMDTAEKNNIPPAERNGVWWCRTIDQVRFAFAITDKAIAYYHGYSLDILAKKPGVFYNSVYFNYRAGIDFYNDFSYQGTTYHRVYVANMALTWWGNCGWLCGLGCIQDRMVIFSETGGLIAVIGDKYPRIGVS